MQVSAPTHVYFDPPVFGEIKPDSALGTTGRPTEYAYHEIGAICKALRETGWDHRALVVERDFYSSGQTADYNMSQIKKWGFVVDLHTVKPGGRAYLPIKVQWMEGTISSHWPEDLFLIQPSRTAFELSNIFKEQLKNDLPV